MTPEEYAKDQLQSAYDRITSDQEGSAKIKNWCITVWIGSVAVVTSGHAPWPFAQRLALPLLPIIFFWLLDAVANSYIGVHVARAKKLEAILLGLEETTPQRLLDLSLAAGYPKRSLKEKIKLFVYFFILHKSVSAFYGLLILITSLLYFKLAR